MRRDHCRCFQGFHKAYLESARILLDYPPGRSFGTQLLFLVLPWIQLPPKLFRKISRIIAHAFQVVEVFGRDVFENFPHPCHADERQPVFPATFIELFAKVAHQLAALGLPRPYRSALDVDTDVSHGGIVHRSTNCIGAWACFSLYPVRYACWVLSSI